MNNTKTQSNVEGWRDITSQLTLNQAYTVKLLINDKLRMAHLTYSRDSWIVTNTASSGIGIPSAYRPEATVSQMRTGTIRILINPDNGNLDAYNYSSSSTTLEAFKLQFDYYY